jgi:hypothetical protein
MFYGHAAHEESGGGRLVHGVHTLGPSAAGQSNDLSYWCLPGKSMLMQLTADGLQPNRTCGGQKVQHFYLMDRVSAGPTHLFQNIVLTRFEGSARILSFR